jgi:hypothetical protein
MPAAAVGLFLAAGENHVVSDVSDEVGQDRVLGGLGGVVSDRLVHQIALAERMDSVTRAMTV